MTVRIPKTNDRRYVTTSVSEERRARDVSIHHFDRDGTCAAAEQMTILLGAIGTDPAHHMKKDRRGGRRNGSCSRKHRHKQHYDSASHNDPSIVPKGAIRARAPPSD